MRAEYDLDYSQARPNRFVERMKGSVVAVVLEPDVAKVFGSSKSVNRALRSVIATTLPGKKSTVTNGKPRRKVS